MTIIIIIKKLIIMLFVVFLFLLVSSYYEIIYQQQQCHNGDYYCNYVKKHRGYTNNTDKEMNGSLSLSSSLSSSYSSNSLTKNKLFSLSSSLYTYSSYWLSSLVSSRIIISIMNTTTTSTNDDDILTIMNNSKLHQQQQKQRRQLRLYNNNNNSTTTNIPKFNNNMIPWLLTSSLISSSLSTTEYHVIENTNTNHNNIITTTNSSTTNSTSNMNHLLITMSPMISPITTTSSPTISPTMNSTTIIIPTNHYNYYINKHMIWIIIKIIIWMVLCVTTLLGIIFIIQNHYRIYNRIRLIYYKIKTCFRHTMHSIRMIWNQYCCRCGWIQRFFTSTSITEPNLSLSYALLSDDIHDISGNISMEENSSIALFDDDPNTDNIIFTQMDDDLMNDDNEDIFPDEP